MVVQRRLLFGLIAAALGCGQAHETPGTQVKMDFARTSLWGAPFPSDELRQGGHVQVPGFDTHEDNLVASALAIARHTPAFATSAGIFFTFTGPIDSQALPNLQGSLAADSPVLL